MRQSPHVAASSNGWKRLFHPQLTPKFKETHGCTTGRDKIPFEAASHHAMPLATHRVHAHELVLYQNPPKSLVERVGFDDVHLLAQGGRIRQPEGVGLERLVRNVLSSAGERVAPTTNKRSKTTPSTPRER